MEAMECIITRRSIREFDPTKKPDKETVNKLIRAAMYAPSAHNKQPWEFLVIDDRKILDEFPKLQQWTKFIDTAPLAIVVCADMANSFKVSENEDFADIDCSAATQNLLLAAHAEGLGACWCGIAPMKERVSAFKNLFNLPENFDPFSIIILGYPLKEPFQPRERFKEEKVHWNKW